MFYYPRRWYWPKVTILLVAANILCYLYERHVGLVFVTSRYGMYQGAIENQQYLRILFSGFMHYDVMHLLSNMLCLFIYGLILERNIGSLKFLLIYMVSLISSGVLINFVGGNGIHMGASGAIWGLMTATLIYNLKNHLSPYYALRGIIINLIYSFGVGVSWQGHIGGGIGGLLIALMLFRSQPMYSQSYVGYTDRPRKISSWSLRRKPSEKEYMKYPDDGRYHP